MTAASLDVPVLNVDAPTTDEQPKTLPIKLAADFVESAGVIAASR